jgi:hypothetical protein
MPWYYRPRILNIELPLKKGNKQNKHWDNTVMGDILIEGNRLILETNSEMRTEKGKKLLSKYLDNHISCNDYQHLLWQDLHQQIQLVYNLLSKSQ